MGGKNSAQGDRLIKVVFVGDEPASINISPEIPFVGARSFGKLVEYIKILAPDYYIVLNSSVSEDIAKILCLAKFGFKIVILGRKAADRLTMIGISSAFELPHPSPKNRKLNSRIKLEELLRKCREWLRI